MAGEIGGFVSRTGELNATGFAAATCVNLRFDDADVGFEALGGFACFFFGEGNFTAGSGDAVAREDRFGLVFVNLHLVSMSDLAVVVKRSASDSIFTVYET
jgi:hypothetical protein